MLRNKPVLKKTSLWDKLKSYLITGIVVTAPVSFTLAVCWWLVNFVDGLMVSLVPQSLNPDLYLRKALGLSFDVPGVGLLTLVLFLILVGGLATGFFGGWLIRRGERLLQRMPLIRSIYSASKQVLEALLKNKSRAFQQTVLVEFPGKGSWTFGFVTSSVGGEVQEALALEVPTDEELITVYVPTTPNPTGGYMLFIPKKSVRFLTMPVDVALRTLISMGMVHSTDDN